MLITAIQKNIRISPRKIRLLAKEAAKLSPRNAVEKLKFVRKSGAEVLAKTIKQAIANSVNNKKLKEETLKFSKIEILSGPVYKRWQPVSRGRAHSIKKRTSSVKVVLEAEDGSKS